MESPGGSTPTLAPTRSSSSFDMHAGAKLSAQELSGEDGMEKAEKAGSASHEEPEYLWVDWAVNDPGKSRGVRRAMLIRLVPQRIPGTGQRVASG